MGYRKSLVEDKTRELNRLQKMLEGANIKLSGTVTGITGKSAMNLLEEVLKGKVVDKKRIARLRKEKKLLSRLKASDEQLVDDRNGFLTPLQVTMIREVLAHIKELVAHIRCLEDEIDRHVDEVQKEAAKKLEAVVGIVDDSAKAIISVIGTDMSRFPTDALSPHGPAFARATMKARRKDAQGRRARGTNYCVHRWWSAPMPQSRTRRPTSLRSAKESVPTGEETPLLRP